MKTARRRKMPPEALCGNNASALSTGLAPLSSHRSLFYYGDEAGHTYTQTHTTQPFLFWITDHSARQRWNEQSYDFMRRVLCTSIYALHRHDIQRSPLSYFTVNEVPLFTFYTTTSYQHLGSRDKIRSFISSSRSVVLPTTVSTFQERRLCF